MKEFPIKEVIPIKLNQYICPGCDKKFYVNQEDFKEGEVLDCPFCDVQGVKNIMLFDVKIHKIFIKEE